MSQWTWVASLSLPGILAALAAVYLLAHSAIWLAYLVLRFGWRQLLMRALDPDSYPRGSLWEAFCEAVRHRIGPPSDRQTFNRPLLARSIVGDPIASGDLCDIHVVRDGSGLPLAAPPGRRLLIKIPRVRGCDSLLEKELRVLRLLRSQPGSEFYGKYFPTPVALDRRNRRAVLTLLQADGYWTAQQIRRRYPAGLDARHLAWMFNRILESLGFVHQHGWVHGAVLPPHLLFHAGDHAFQLVGWIHCVPIETPLQVVSRRFKSWYPPACHRREPATPATDLHLAAKSMIWLAGGGPHADQIPQHVPTEMAGFWRDCLHRSSPHSDRPGNGNLAWRLHEQFRELLEDLYGPPEFCHLDMA